jgi:2,4-dienoyl-CoA reductase-like NADH-dependent reductase (Old Yellow Enzyme family)
MGSHLFRSFTLRKIRFRNRIFVSPMCQYSSRDGFANDWHLVHLGGMAKGGAGLVMAEATAVDPVGRISPQDLGIWKDEHLAELQRITTFIKGQGSVAGIQLAHAGRKASTPPPWEGEGVLTEKSGGWTTVAPSPIAFHDGDPLPEELGVGQIEELVARFVEAAERSLAAGFEVVELHMAHGYLLHQFLSPLANKRTDQFGGSLENRMRFPLRVAEAVRKRWPENLPLFVRISATDWTPGGWDLEQSIQFSRQLKDLGVDFIDVSTGGAVPHAVIPVAPLFQVPFAEQIREEAEIATGAVGMITTSAQAEEILATGSADAVLLARAFLRDPHWPMRAAIELGETPQRPVQYQRASD